jgi:hypothetical protein
MRPSLVPNRMALPPPRKVVLTSIALAAAVALVAVASWPLKVLVVLVFVRGLFASDLIGSRQALRAAGQQRQGSL